MCLTREEITSMLDNLSDVPGLMSMAEPGTKYGMIEFEVLKGRMLSWNLLDEENCTIFHTNFSAFSELNWHHHNKSWERIVCISGSIELELYDGSKILLTPGEEYRIEKMIVHKARTFAEKTWILAINVPKE